MNIAIVLVTYNRLEKLIKTLSCYDNLLDFPQDIIVVNNDSNDGTKDYLLEWQNKRALYAKHIINLDKNTGGSGGFYEGQKYALGLNPDWVMLADDDAYPAVNMIEEFVKFVSSHNTNNTAAICAEVLRTDGSIDTSHRSRYHLVKGLFYERTRSRYEDYNNEWFNIDLLSYVGCFIKREALIEKGLVNPDYFIYSDDSEHSIRLKKYGEIICVPAIKIIHDEQFAKQIDTLTWKDYYGYRNEIDMLKRHHFIAAITWTRRQLKLLKHFPEKKKVYKEAMKDAWFGRLGKHSIYKPGWTCEKKQ
jgi:GT2 family glycosyltransferase